VKAFDSVDRALMLDILRGYGVPEHLVNLIHLLHTDVAVRFAVGKVEAEISSTVGAKQGDTLAPILFLFVIQAAMETLELVFGEHGIKVPTFRTADDDVLTGRKTGEAGKTFTFGKGLYAGDAGLLFETRADLELGARLLKQHLTRFGLVMQDEPGRRRREKVQDKGCLLPAGWLYCDTQRHAPSLDRRRVRHRHVHPAVPVPRCHLVLLPLGRR
jgi:hypothetical protein